MIRVKIVPNDISTVVKIVLVDGDNRVLLVKRSNYTPKFSGEWDLPGGHLKNNESLIAGLEREVKEETNLAIREPVLFHSESNLNFFYGMYDSQEIKLSSEHVDYKFFEEKELNPTEKFQNIAIIALRKIKEIKND